MSSSEPVDLVPEPDLHPFYPTAAHISILLSSHSGLTPQQKGELVAHCLSRACTFGELSVIQYLLSDSQAQAHVDLGFRDEDGVGLVSSCIHGFGAESDRDVEREECVRLLVAQGADLSPDNSGWTPLHHAALLSPPTLISYLMTHGCSPFGVTRRNLTALDIVTGHSMMPGRDDVALLLEEAMRGEGWAGGRMTQGRRHAEQRLKRKRKRVETRLNIGKALGITPRWWDSDSDTESESDTEEEHDEQVYTPPANFASMLVFSPPALPHIFDALITNYQPKLRDATPANTLYLLARFACLTCDHTWLEDLIMGATDTIEETFFSRAEDVSSLVFWLYNTTIWLHLLQCDNSISEACDMLGSFELIEEVLNSVFVFVIRFAERRIDQLLDSTLLDHTPLPSELGSVEFESEWSFLRPFTGKRKGNAPTPTVPHNTSSSPPSPGRPISPSHSQPALSSPAAKGFSSLRQTLARTAGTTKSHPPNTQQEAPSSPSPYELTSFLTALHSFLTMADVNPAFTTQLWSQVMYWTSCEIFNRIITRKKYLCRSRASQISMNLVAIDEWIRQAGLPAGVQSHLVPVKDLLNWLQCLSSVSEFSDLVATIQTMKHINPLQMRRAVRDYKYEVNEGRMNDECIQYLTQLQKDWERHRVKLGVEALRKEIMERDRDRESISSSLYEGQNTPKHTVSTSSSVSEIPPARHSIDILFDKTSELEWEPGRPPQVLGELLDSRYMLPLLFPSNPRLLAAVPKACLPIEAEYHDKHHSKTASEGSCKRPHLEWRSKGKRVREVDVAALRCLDGQAAVRWGRTMHLEDDDDDENAPHLHSYTSDESGVAELATAHTVHITPLTRKPSARGKTRASAGD